MCTPPPQRHVVAGIFTWDRRRGRGGISADVIWGRKYEKAKRKRGKCKKGRKENETEEKGNEKEKRRKKMRKGCKRVKKCKIGKN
jgi:hypothetical protein